MEGGGEFDGSGGGGFGAVGEERGRDRGGAGDGNSGDCRPAERNAIINVHVGFNQVNYFGGGGGAAGGSWDLGGNWGGEGSGAPGGEPGGDGSGGGIVNQFVNFNGGGNAINVLGGGEGIAAGMRGSWGQGLGQFAEIGSVLSPTAPPAVPSWNYFSNSVLRYSFWNGYPPPNYLMAPAPLMSGPPQSSSVGGTNEERAGTWNTFSRKVFVGGLPTDIDEAGIISCFRHFGPLVVDWPGKCQDSISFAFKGFAFLIFEEEASVEQLVRECVPGQGEGQNSDSLFYFVNSPTIHGKRVQVRPWRLSDDKFSATADSASENFCEIKMAFVGNLPGQLKASDLARLMDGIFGGVCHAKIKTDKEFRFPKGCGRVGFWRKESYEAAVAQKLVWFQFENNCKQVVVKPYVGLV